MEGRILEVVSFNLVMSSPIQLQHLYLTYFQITKEQYHLSKYFLESSMINHKMIYYSASILAIACLYLSNQIFLIKENQEFILNSKENIADAHQPISFSTNDIEEKELKECAINMWKNCRSLFNSELSATKRKYSKPIYCSILKMVEQYFDKENEQEF